MGKFVALQETVAARGERPALYELAEKMHQQPDGFARYDYTKSVWWGVADREARLAGNHPWPTRTHNNEEFIYSVPVAAMASAEDERLLYVGKDDWKDPLDPHAWLVAERDVFGEERDREILAVSLAGHELWMQLAPRERDPYRHDYLTGMLDDSFILQRLQLWRGRYAESAYEDYEALESMIIMVGQVRSARMEAERQYYEEQAMRFALGRRGATYGGIGLAA